MLHAINPGKFKSTAILCLLFLFIYSCKKEYTDYPYNEMEKFVINDGSGAELKAAIQNNKIIIYYPPLQTIPDSITPEITISERAVISPESGVKIPFKDGLTYTVTAQDGTKQTYELQAAVNQPPLNFITGNTILGTFIGLNGEYFITDTTQTKVSLIDRNKKEIRIPANVYAKLTAASIVVNLPARLGIDTGSYMVKLTSGKRSSTQGPILIGEAAVRLSYPNQTTIRRGEEYTVTDTSGYAMMIRRNGENINRGVSVYVNNSQYVPVSVTKLSATELTIKIPADCPLGYFYLGYGKSATGANVSLFNITSTKRITITP